MQKANPMHGPLLWVTEGLSTNGETASFSPYILLARHTKFEYTVGERSTQIVWSQVILFPKCHANNSNYPNLVRFWKGYLEITLESHNKKE